MNEHITRRRMVGSALVAGVTTVGLSAPAVAGRKQATPESPDTATPEAELIPGGEATMPNWVFVVHGYQDPYIGDIASPAGSQDGTRYFGAEVEVRNDAEVPLNFVVSHIRLRAGDGTEYNAGSVNGAEPHIASNNMSPGDVARGWVWFALEGDTEVAELFYTAPSPRLVVSLSGE